MPASAAGESPGTAETGNALPHLGGRLRSARRARNLSMEAAAGLAGLSASHLSRMESGARAPSLPILLTLARTYATTVSALLGETADHAESIIRSGGTRALHAHGWTYWRAGEANRAMQALRIRVAAGDDDGPDRIHPGEEWLYVLTGTLRLHLDGTAHHLPPGDAAHFDSATPHRIGSATDEDVTLLMVHAPGPAQYRACTDHPLPQGRTR